MDIDAFNPVTTADPHPFRSKAHQNSALSHYSTLQPSSPSFASSSSSSASSCSTLNYAYDIYTLPSTESHTCTHQTTSSYFSTSPIISSTSAIPSDCETESVPVSLSPSPSSSISSPSTQSSGSTGIDGNASPNTWDLSSIDEVESNENEENNPKNYDVVHRCVSLHQQASHELNSHDLTATDRYKHTSRATHCSEASHVQSAKQCSFVMDDDDISSFMEDEMEADLEPMIAPLPEQPLRCFDDFAKSGDGVTRTTSTDSTSSTSSTPPLPQAFPSFAVDTDKVMQQQEEEQVQCCAICLYPMIKPPLATPDTCACPFHYRCLLQWRKVAHEPATYQYPKGQCKCPRCYQRFSSIVKGIELVSYDSVYCETCRFCDDDANMLLCDRCNRGFHLYCLRPMLKRVPDGNWYCHRCKDADADHETQSKNTHPSSSASKSSGKPKSHRAANNSNNTPRKNNSRQPPSPLAHDSRPSTPTSKRQRVVTPSKSFTIPERKRVQPAHGISTSTATSNSAAAATKVPPTRASPRLQQQRQAARGPHLQGVKRQVDYSQQSGDDKDEFDSESETRWTNEVGKSRATSRNEATGFERVMLNTVDEVVKQGNRRLRFSHIVDGSRILLMRGYWEKVATDFSRDNSSSIRFNLNSNDKGKNNKTANANTHTETSTSAQQHQHQRRGQTQAQYTAVTTTMLVSASGSHSASSDTTTETAGSDRVTYASSLSIGTSIPSKSLSASASLRKGTEARIIDGGRKSAAVIYKKMQRSSVSGNTDGTSSAGAPSTTAPSMRNAQTQTEGKIQTATEREMGIETCEESSRRSVPFRVIPSKFLPQLSCESFITDACKTFLKEFYQKPLRMDTNMNKDMNMNLNKGADRNTVKQQKSDKATRQEVMFMSKRLEPLVTSYIYAELSRLKRHHNTTHNDTGTDTDMDTVLQV